MAKLAPLLDYSEGGFSGQLTLNLDSIFTEPSNQSSYTYRLTETREYTGFERNDTYGVPKTVNKGGTTLQLVDVSWTPWEMAGTMPRPAMPVPRQAAR